MRHLVISLMLVVGPAAIAAGDPILDVTKLFQNDYPDLIDSSSSSIAEFGCTLTAYAMMFNYEMGKLGLHKKNSDGTRDGLLSYTPADLNRLLNAYRYEQPTYQKDPNTGKNIKTGDSLRMNGWAQALDAADKPQGSTTVINVGALMKAVARASKADSFENTGLELDKRTTPEVPKNGMQVDGSTKEIRNQLDAGHPVLARVSDDTHTVLIIGWDEAKGFLIADPFRKEDDSSESELSAYNNLVFALETIFKGGGLPTPFEVPSDYFIPLDALQDPDINPDLFGPQAFRENHVPEPASGVLVLAGLLVFAGLRKSGQRRARSGRRAEHVRAV